MHRKVLNISIRNSSDKKKINSSNQTQLKNIFFGGKAKTKFAIHFQFFHLQNFLKGFLKPFVSSIISRIFRGPFFILNTCFKIIGNTFKCLFKKFFGKNISNWGTLFVVTCYFTNLDKKTFLFWISPSESSFQESLLF